MPFFVARNEFTSEFEKLLDADVLMKANPDYYGPRFDAIKDLRDSDDGTGHKGQEFRRVASFTNVPMLLATKLADPDFLKDKRKFYAFIDRHPEYVSYQRRGAHSRAEMARQKMPLSALGIDYPGAPETIEGWDEVQVPLEDTNIPEDVVSDSAEGTHAE